MAYSIQQMQYYNQNQNCITSSIIQKKFKPLHEPIVEVQSKDEFSINADILSSQQMNYSLSKQLLYFDKKNKQGSAVDIIKANALHNSIEMSQRLIGSQIYPTNNLLQVDDQYLNTPKNIINSNNQINQLNSQNLNNNYQVAGDVSLCIDNMSNNGNDFNEKTSTTYDPSNHLGTKPTTLSFMNQHIVAPVAYSNNFGSNDQLAGIEQDEQAQDVVADIEKKSIGKKSAFQNSNKKEKQTNQQELILMNCPHCKNHITLFQDKGDNISENQNCLNIFHKIFSFCQSCSCNQQNQVSQKYQCPECQKDIQIS
ncbi:hypothetical protein TTHERM_00576800 (macronuclear) [Tetrahymena thermophila SB210]|uniref:LITAF-like zinc ribbon domain protein n=1 Tax=Tetrahymena thermophila (strain SB210) TaxID=312017 RepID=Q22V19_TETTS|nr:hypothetical protein TTHERM_00576800 [Tetrahymena thermophila SB210]EAR89129.2 hypothetical protein TTHERM_00576800 [Tetrahymena thermophila SB210]|eukprot:XP_001009374.2 hypothetical protein TTHERM_00576800 [Tetrahymena thermophila SB210]